MTTDHAAFIDDLRARMTPAVSGGATSAHDSSTAMVESARSCAA